MAQVDPAAPAPVSRPVEPLEAGSPTPEPQAASQRPDLTTSAWWWIRAAAMAATAYVVYQLLVIVEGAVSAVLEVVLFVVFGAILAFILAPLVEALQRWARMPRTLAILLSLLLALSVLGGLIALVAGPIVTEARSLAGQVPDLINRGNGELDRLSTYLRNHGLPISGVDLSGNQKELSSRLTGVLLGSLTTTLRVVVDMIVVIVVAFWLLKDGRELRAGFVSLLPSRLHVNVEFALDAVSVVIGGYVRAQLFLAAVIGVLAGVGCAIIGVPFPLVVALAAGVFELVPLVGPFIGGGVALLLALTKSPVLAIVTVGLFLGIHVIEGYVLSPRIQAKFVRLHPLVALLALFAGIDLGGFLGALFAVPAASLAAVFIRAAVGDWRANRPDLFAADRADLHSERRRESILGEFRLFKRPPRVVARALVNRLQGKPDPSDPATDPGDALR